MRVTAKVPTVLLLKWTRALGVVIDHEREFFIIYVCYSTLENKTMFLFSKFRHRLIRQWPARCLVVKQSKPVSVPHIIVHVRHDNRMEPRHVLFDRNVVYFPFHLELAAKGDIPWGALSRVIQLLENFINILLSSGSRAFASIGNFPACMLMSSPSNTTPSVFCAQNHLNSALPSRKAAAVQLCCF